MVLFVVVGTWMDLRGDEVPHGAEYFAADEAYDGFSTRLRNSYPQLTEKEVRFCMLVRLGLTNHELTNVYSISEASMKQRLFDYKARLGLTDPAVSLRRFLTTF